MGLTAVSQLWLFDTITTSNRAAATLLFHQPHTAERIWQARVERKSERQITHTHRLSQQNTPTHIQVITRTADWCLAYTRAGAGNERACSSPARTYVREKKDKQIESLSYLNAHVLSLQRLMQNPITEVIIWWGLLNWRDSAPPCPFSSFLNLMITLNRLAPHGTHGDALFCWPLIWRFEAIAVKQRQRKPPTRLLPK